MGVGEQYGLDDEDPNAHVYTTDVDASEDEDEDIPEEVAEKEEANHEVMKPDQMLVRAKGRQKDARAEHGFYHKGGPKGSGKGLPSEHPGRGTGPPRTGSPG